MIITSATLNTDKFIKYFNCPTFHIPGRCFPVQLFHLEKPPAHWLDCERLPHSPIERHAQPLRPRPQLPWRRPWPFTAASRPATF